MARVYRRRRLANPRGGPAPNRLQRDARRGFELEDADGLSDQSGWSASKSVMKLPVLLSRWASARLMLAVGAPPRLAFGRRCRQSGRTNARSGRPCHGKARQRSESIDTDRPRAEPVDVVVRRARCGRMQPTSHGRVPLIRDERVEPPPTGQALRSVAEIYRRPLIQIVELASGVPRHRGPG